MEQQSVTTSLSPSSDPSNPHPNPCVRVRESRGFTVPQWARIHRVNKLVVQQAEAGCYSKPPPKLYQPYLTPEDYILYANYRTFQRKQNYPTPPPFETFQELLDDAGNSFRLSLKLCVQYPEIHRVKSGRIYRLPSETRTALLEIGMTDTQLLLIESSTVLNKLTTLTATPTPPTSTQP